MALEVLSTLESIEARASEARVLLWTDKDDDTTPDATTLAQGFQEATGIIFEYLNRRYGETVLATWTLATAPARLLRISDDLCIYIFSSGNFAQNELITEIRENAIASLEAIRDKKSDLYGATEAVTLTSATEQPDSIFTDRVYFNE